MHFQDATRKVLSEVRRLVDVWHFYGSSFTNQSNVLHLGLPNLAAKFLSPTRGAPNVTAVTGGIAPPPRLMSVASQNLLTASSVFAYTSSTLSDSALPEEPKTL